MLSVFLITKPLQYFNATNIEDNNTKTCLIVDGFYNSSVIFKKILHQSLYWDESLFFYSWMKAYNWIKDNKQKIEKIYIDSDYGLKKQWVLSKLSQIDIYVYEEGIGNYRKYKRSEKKRDYLIKYFYKSIGIQDYLGGGVNTKGLYIYDIDKFKNLFPQYNKQLFSFKESFRDHLNHFKDKEIFLGQQANDIIRSSNGKEVVIYLTSWQYDDRINDILHKYPHHIKILKPHPHLILENLEYSKIYDYILSGDILIELFINEAIKCVKDVVVVHHSSSALMYFENEKKITSIII